MNTITTTTITTPPGAIRAAHFDGDILYSIVIMFDKRFPGDTEYFSNLNRALSTADFMWSIMSDYKKKRCVFFAVMEGSPSHHDNNIIDLRPAKIIKRYK